VSSRGQIVIPAQLRRRLKISRTVFIKEEDGKIILEPAATMEEAFGTGGKEMHRVAVDISRDRRREVEESKRKKLSV
jgi:AbrB family looped-hinge helix DNA binding protein